MSTVTRLTAHQIIDETVEYYSKNPRSFVTNGITTPNCVYLNEKTGAMCAFGRCLTEESLKLAHEYYEELRAHTILGIAEIKLKPQYEGQTPAFWQVLQHLHDVPRFWNGNELTDLGVRRVRQLKELFV